MTTPDVEVRVEDPHLRDRIDGQSVALSDLTDRLGRRAVVDAEGLAVVVSDVRVHPRHTEVGVGRDHRGNRLDPVVVDRDVQPVRKATFHEVARHFWSPFQPVDPASTARYARVRIRTSGDAPYLWATCSPSCTPRRTASRAASARLATPSFDSTDDTWWSTVFGDSTNWSAMSELRRPRAISRSTSSSRV